MKAAIFPKVESSSIEFDEFHREVPDTTPHELYLKSRVPETSDERIARILRRELIAEADRRGFETLADAMDFDLVDPDLAPLSGFEFEPPPPFEFVGSEAAPSGAAEPPADPNAGSTPASNTPPAA